MSNSDRNLARLRPHLANLLGRTAGPAILDILAGIFTDWRVNCYLTYLSVHSSRGWGHFVVNAVDASVTISVPISVTVGRSITMEDRIRTLYVLNSRLVFWSPLSYF